MQQSQHQSIANVTYFKGISFQHKLQNSQDHVIIIPTFLNNTISALSNERKWRTAQGGQQAKVPGSHPI